ncbi:hypothetical protein A2U01_0084815, partial [Trifolium medium]|nr:hypothetical protein [Trifolium medium]
MPLIKPLGGDLFSMSCTRASSWEDLLRQWCGSHARVLPPPSKPPDSSFQQGKVEFQVKQAPFMPPPLPEPPDNSNRAMKM